MEITSTDLSFNLPRHTEFKSDKQLAGDDIIQSIKAFNLWNYLALNEIRRRYRRTVIGPFWTTLSVGIFISVMSIMLSLLWKTEIKEFLPYFCSGYICWTMMSMIVNEGCNTFVSNTTFMRQLSMPYVIYACLVVWRNFIVFAHHIVILFLVLIFCGKPVNLNILYFIPGLLIIFVTGVTLCVLLGMICARFRDLKQVVESSLQLVMFVTPIMWQPQQLGRKGMIFTKFNPIYHYISILRMPLLGEAPPLSMWLATICCTGLLIAVTFMLFSKKYRNLIFWL
jgi:lipopolysaccharide transport system permease protein